MKKTVFGVIASFSCEPTPSYTVALFDNKPEAEKFCKWCGENVDRVQELTGLQEDVRDFFVIPMTLHENFLDAIDEIKNDAV